jgi:hypothetical protein
LRKIIRILVIVVVIALMAGGSFVGIIANLKHTQTNSTTDTGSTSSLTVTTSSNSTSSSNNIENNSKPVGAFYYQWYGYDYTTSQWTGGFGTSHWNDSPVGVVSDRPIQGYYSMMDNNTVSSQITEMEQSGINFAVVSWWGWGVYNFSNPSIPNASDVSINAATAHLFKLVSSQFPKFKLAIMVDAFNESAISPKNYSSIYQYVEDQYYSKYPSVILRNETTGIPYIFWFNPLDPYTSSLNQSFVNEVVGNNPYVNITLWRAPTSDLQGESNQILSNYEGNPSISTNGIVSILPRYDDYGLYLAGGRSSYMRFDVSFNESLYQYEWNYVLNNTNRVNMVLIYSWNEYHERSAIEPHYDNTSSVSPFYLLNLTKYFVTKLEGGQPSAVNFSVYQPTFNFKQALNFYASELNTSIGLMSTTPNGTTIYLADDQALDYIALLGLYDKTGNSSALALANQINASIQTYGGLFHNWNAIFVLFGDYQLPWNFSSGNKIIVEQKGQYTINTTVFNNIMGPYNTAKYTDLELYYAIYNLKTGNYSGAEDAFIAANRLWNGFGFADAAVTNNAYSSYKLALDIMVWKILENSSQTEQFAIQYTPELNQVQREFSSFQQGDGGVITDYKITNGAIMPTGQENGETTSLFVLADLIA